MKQRVKKFFTVSLAVILSLFGLLTTVVLFLTVSDTVAESTARVLPSYERLDLSSVLRKDVWTDSDYDLLYHQTGLGAEALDELKSDPAAIVKFQDALFYEGKISHVEIGPITYRDVTDYFAPLAPLHKGDVMVSSVCHTMGWRNGHAALVINPETGTLLESVEPGTNSRLSRSGDTWFQRSANFMVLRLKEQYRAAVDPAELAEDARNNLRNVPYSLLVGIFSDKNQGREMEATNCSHLVWQAFKNFGFDIDADGGPVCTSRDIAASPYFEVVQVYGFDPDKLW